MVTTMVVQSKTLRVFVTLCICWIDLGNPHKFQVTLAPVEGNNCQLASNCSNDRAYLLENPNLAVHYTSRDNLERLRRYQAHKSRKMGPFRTITNNFSPSDISLKIYTSKNGIQSPTIVKYDGLRTRKMTKAGFNPRIPTKIAVHGFQSNSGEMEGLAKVKYIFQQLLIQSRPLKIMAFVAFTILDVLKNKPRGIKGCFVQSQNEKHQCDSHGLERNYQLSI